MKVKVNIHDICTAEELDVLKRDCSVADNIVFDYTLLSDGNYDTFCSITFDKIGMFKYFALKRYEKSKKGKVSVTRL